MDVLESHAFRVTRDAELAIQELEADDLLETIEQFVRRRRFGSVIRVTIDDKMPPRVRDILTENLELSETDIYEVRSPLGLSSLWGAGSIDRPELKYAPLVQSVPPSLAGLEGSELFAAIRHRDVLLHHPYDSFDPVVEFLRAAANDPDVLAIKQTLYRCGRNAPAVEQLMEAAANGKQVAVLVELKARFDEESNIGWAKALEREGAHVVYGLIGLKTHCKALQVVRREGDRIRRYTHLGTGNYNSVTTKQYTDLGYLTADDDIGADATLVFNHLTGDGQATEYRKLLVAPVNMRQGIDERIDREIAHAEAGREAHLIFKMNSLVDKPMIRKLYRASQAGVKVELNVRGMCCLRPGVPGVSENITEQSIVGRFLEHSRIYWFRNGGDEEVILGSADLMPRNLNRRVEILFPVQDKGILRRIRDEILPTYLNDNMKTRVLGRRRLLDAHLARRRRGAAQRAGVVRGQGARAVPWTRASTRDQGLLPAARQGREPVGVAWRRRPTGRSRPRAKRPCAARPRRCARWASAWTSSSPARWRAPAGRRRSSPTGSACASVCTRTSVWRTGSTRAAWSSSWRRTRTAGAVMVVGHEPDFSATVAELIGGGDIVMKKGGLARVDVTAPVAGGGELVWLLTPPLLGSR